MCLDLGVDRFYLELFSTLVRTKFGAFSIIIIMYIYHALINAMSAHMIHINLKMKFYTHVEYILKSSFVVLYVHRKSMAYWGRGENGIGNESPGPPPCSHIS